MFEVGHGLIIVADLDISPRERYKVALGLADMPYYRTSMDYIVCSAPKQQLKYPRLLDYPADYSLTQITVHPLSRGRMDHHANQITSRADYYSIPLDVMERLFVFRMLGGTEKEFWELQRYKDIVDKGEQALALPPDVKIDRYFGRYKKNPQMRGLKEVHLVGNTEGMGMPLSHTRWHHLFNCPRAFSGKALDTVSLALFAALDPSVIHAAQQFMHQFIQ